MSDGLKPCPFCGRAAKLFENTQGDYESAFYYSAGCINCPIELVGPDGMNNENREKTVAAWNRRV